MIRTPYNTKEAEFLSDIVKAGLTHIKNTGARSNYEDFCDAILTSTDAFFLPEWKQYWEKKKELFISTQGNKGRDKVFKDTIKDIREKGLFVGSLSTTLSGKINNIVQKILSIPD